MKHVFERSEIGTDAGSNVLRVISEQTIELKVLKYHFHVHCLFCDDLFYTYIIKLR